MSNGSTHTDRAGLRPLDPATLRRPQMRTLLARSLIGILLCLTSTRVLHQQGTSEIGGRVVDDPGAALPGVAIVVTNEETGVFREVTSGADGSYFASQLTPGRYRLVARLASFKSFERSGLVLPVGKTL